MNKRVAVVTGGIGGLGTEICKALARVGCTVIAADLGARVERIAEFGASFLSDAMRDINRSMGTVGRSTYASASSYFRDKEKVARVREVLERAAREIDEIVGKTTV